MSNSSLDANSQSTITAGLNTNGLTITRLKANDSTNALKVSNGTTGSDFGPVGHTLRDENSRLTWFAVSSADGITPITLYANSAGALLIQST